MRYPPHGACWFWDPELILLHVFADAVITAAYMLIPLFLLAACAERRRRGLEVWQLYSFAAFVFLCGTTHLWEILTVWLPLYWSQGFVKLACAVVSVGAFVGMAQGRRYRSVVRALASYGENGGRLDG